MDSSGTPVGPFQHSHSERAHVGPFQHSQEAVEFTLRSLTVHHYSILKLSQDVVRPGGNIETQSARCCAASVDGAAVYVCVPCACV